MYNFPNSVRVQLTPATDNHRSPITSFSRARALLIRNKSTSLPSVPQRRTEHTAGHTEFVEGTFVLNTGHFSTAVVPAGIFSEGEQPTAVTCNYERLAERNSQTRRVQPDRWALLHWTAINLPHTCLCPGGCNEEARNMSRTWTTLKADTGGARLQRARWPGLLNSLRRRLTLVGPECGTWFMSLTWRLKF